VNEVGGIQNQSRHIISAEFLHKILQFRQGGFELLVLMVGDG